MEVVVAELVVVEVVVVDVAVDADEEILVTDTL